MRAMFGSEIIKTFSKMASWTWEVPPSIEKDEIQYLFFHILFSSQLLCMYLHDKIQQWVSEKTSRRRR